MIALIGAARPAAAQGPNAEEDDDRWAAAAELSMTATSGNQDVTVLATGFTLRHLRQELFDFELKLQARYGSSRGEQVVENYQGTFNLDFGPGHRWSPFIYSTAEHDPFKRLDVRVSSGAGAKYRLYRAENSGEASLSLAMLHSYEALTTDVPTRTTSARWSLRLTGRQEIRDGVTVSSQALYEPVYNDTGDYLLAVDAGLKVLVTRSIALSVTHEYNQDSTPADGVGEIDRLLKAGILIEL
ncbi:MAG TPA: DUF481 domain-containing protein [Longimicrobiales bacterium]